MTMDLSEPTVYIVDDEASVCRCLARMVRQARLEARTFPSAEEFLAERPDPWPHPACLILDLQMPGLGGLELQRELASDLAPCPIVFISGNGDIPSTVQAMQQGAVTFLTKPFDDEALLKTIRDGIETHRALIESSSHVQRLRRRIDSLTEREREVMAWVISGVLNKQIADELGIAEQTVKVHRGRVMEKMHTVSLAQLVRMCVSAGFQSQVR